MTKHSLQKHSRWQVVGETHTHFHRDGHELYFETDILAGIPFMECNDISIRPARHQVGQGGIHTLSGELISSVLDHLILFWRGKFVELELPGELVNVSEELAVEPHDASTQWLLPALYKGISSRIRIPNLTGTPQGSLLRETIMCRIRMIYVQWWKEY